MVAKIIFAVMLVMQINVAFADADQSATANATSNVNAGAAASADNNSVTMNTNTSGVTLAPGAVATNATAGASTSQIGDVSVQTGNTNVNMTFQGSKQDIPPPAAFVPSVSGTVPQLFSAPNATVQEAGLALAMYYEEVCPSPAVRGYEDDLMSRVFDGVSGNTEIVFVPHINSVRDTKYKPKKKRLFGLVDASQEKVEVEEVLPISFGKSGHYKCLGIITVSAKDKEAGKVNQSVVMADAKNFPLKNMAGFPKISLLSSRDAIAITKGMDNSGTGLSVGGGMSQFFNPLLGAVGGSASSTSGVTYPGTKMGATFMVMVEVDPIDPNAVFIDLSPKKPEPKLSVVEKPAEVSVVDIPPLAVVPAPAPAPPAVEKVEEKVAPPAPPLPPPAATENKTVVPVVAVAKTKRVKKVAKKEEPKPVPVSYVINCENEVNCIVNIKDNFPAQPQPDNKKVNAGGAVGREEEPGFFQMIFR